MTVVPQRKLSWQESARKVQAVRDRSIEHVDPAIAALPDTHTGRVIDFPRKHLSQTEIAITESSDFCLPSVRLEGYILTGTDVVLV